MRTSVYNPSHMETEFANAVDSLRNEIQSKTNYKIIDVKKNGHLDNPDLIFKAEDMDGDVHEVVVRFIQRVEF
jgi:hypothetical protein